MNLNSELELDRKIELQRKKFFQTLMAKKIKIRRIWLLISSITNAHLLQTLPYRAMLGHVGELAAERENARSTRVACDSDKSENTESVSACSDLNVQTDDEETDEGIFEGAVASHYSTVSQKND